MAGLVPAIHVFGARPRLPHAASQTGVFVYVARALRTIVRATRCHSTALDDIPARPNCGTGEAIAGQTSTGGVHRARHIQRQNRKDDPMSITAERKQALITEYATKPGDTGSAEVQVAILTERIANLTGHFKSHAKDNHSRRGLLKMVSARRGLLDYLKKTEEARYKSLIQRLGIRR